MTLTHIDLFAGIGGFSLGFERAGIDTLAHVEIDTKCQGVLHRHWENHLIFSDVCAVGKDNLPYADIITFGSPCQDLSIAGKRKGFADGTRSNLFFEAARIIREIEPRYAVWENVPGALSSHNGRDFQSVLECLLDTNVPMPKSGRWASAGMVRTGQKEIAWRILDAQYFGVAQRRRRLLLIFCARDGSPSSILFEREGVRWNPPARGKEGQGTSGFSPTGFGKYSEELGTLRANGGDLGGGSETIIGFDLAQITSKLNYSNPKAGDPQPPINTFAQGMVAYENHPADSRITETGDISQQLTSRMGMGGGNLPLVANTYRMTAFGEYSEDGSASALKQRDYKDATDIVVSALQARDYKGVGSQYVNDGKCVATSWTLRSGKEGGGKGYLGAEEKAMTLGGQQQFVGVRRLTPTECERLQGFPDGWTDGQSDSTRYKQLGNAVAVPVAEWIGKRINR